MSNPVQRRTPSPGADGNIPHGSRWDSGYVVRATSAGPGQPSLVRNPYKGPPKRVISGAGTARLRGDHIQVTPTSTPAGETFNLVLEF